MINTSEEIFPMAEWQFLNRTRSEENALFREDKKEVVQGERRCRRLCGKNLSNIVMSN
jgi:hypothetical protein